MLIFLVGSWPAGMYLMPPQPSIMSPPSYPLQLVVYHYIKFWALFTPFPLSFEPCPLYEAHLTVAVCPLGPTFCIFQFALPKLVD